MVSPVVLSHHNGPVVVKYFYVYHPDCPVVKYFYVYHPDCTVVVKHWLQNTVIYLAIMPVPRLLTENIPRE